MEHTPGPWYVVPLPWDDSMCIVTSKSPDPHIGEIICRTDEREWGEHTDEDVIRWQANARLIASAPDLAAERDALRAAAKVLVNRIEQYKDIKIKAEGASGFTVWDLLGDEVDKVRAALGAEEAA